MLKEDTIVKYCKAVGESSPIFNDPEEAKSEGYPALVAPPTTVAIYAFRGFFDEVKMPAGSLHATQRFEFMHPALAGDVLTSTCKVISKHESKGEKHFVVEAITKNQYGKVVVRSRMGAIWAK